MGYRCIRYHLYLRARRLLGLPVCLKGREEIDLYRNGLAAYVLSHPLSFASRDIALLPVHTHRMRPTDRE